MAPSPLKGSFHAAERIVVPVAGTDREFLAQQWAVEFAAALGIPVHAVHIATPEEDENMRPDEGPFANVTHYCEKWGVTVTTRSVMAENIVQEILDELNARDLVVIGTARLASAHYHVGSVAGELVRRAPCPVQIVRLD